MSEQNNEQRSQAAGTDPVDRATATPSWNSWRPIARTPPERP